MHMCIHENVLFLLTLSCRLVNSLVEVCIGHDSSMLVLKLSLYWQCKLISTYAALQMSRNLTVQCYSKSKNSNIFVICLFLFRVSFLIFFLLSHPYMYFVHCTNVLEEQLNWNEKLISPSLHFTGCVYLSASPFIYWMFLFLVTIISSYFLFALVRIQNDLKELNDYCRNKSIILNLNIEEKIVEKLSYVHQICFNFIILLKFKIRYSISKIDNLRTYDG